MVECEDVIVTWRQIPSKLNFDSLRSKLSDWKLDRRIVCKQTQLIVRREDLSWNDIACIYSPNYSLTCCREGLSTETLDQPEWSGVREPSFGMGTFTVENNTHAVWRWHRNKDTVTEVRSLIWLLWWLVLAELTLKNCAEVLSIGPICWCLFPSGDVCSHPSLPLGKKETTVSGKYEDENSNGNAIILQFKCCCV